MNRSRIERRNQRSRKQDRGVVLLIVLSLLVLFAIMTVTFVVISGHFRASAASQLRQRRGDDEPRRQSDRVLYTLLRDTIDPTSVMRGQSLLRDIYGDDGLKGLIPDPNIPGNPPPAQLLNGTFLELPVQITVGSAEDVASYYSGCVLTLTSGRAKGTSLRIVDYRFDPAGGINFPIFRVQVPTGDYAPPDLINLLNADLYATPPVPVEVVINGRPFSGEGFGLYSTDAALNPPDNILLGTTGTFQGTWKLDRPHPGPDNGWGIAGIDDDGANGVDDPTEWLWPGSDDSWSCMFPNHWMLPNTDIRVRGYAEGGGDEDYDTFDMQNMALGAVIYEGPDYAIPIHIEPSFHRTALINFWFNWIDETWLKPAGVPDTPPGPPPGAHPSLRRLGIFLRPFGPDNRPSTGDEDPFFAANPSYAYLMGQIANVRRMIMMRPTPEFNPDFTGSNERLLAAYGSLSRIDSLTGLAYLHNPLVYGPFDVDNDLDGTPDSVWIDAGLPVRSEPNGRVSKPLVAIHCVDLDGRFNLNAHGFPVAGPWPASLPPQYLAGGGMAATLPYGSGYGPPEINISWLLGATETMSLLFGNPNNVGRYGLDGVPGAALPASETVARRKFGVFPYHYFNPINHVAFETPADLWGELQMGLDIRGCPSYSIPNPGRNLTADHPFELDFSAKIPSGAATLASRDRMYDIGELDAILRRNDMASGDVASGTTASGRLGQLVTALNERPTGPPPLLPNQSNANRTMVTTHSFDLPIPNLPRPADWTQGRRPRHISELIKERVRDRYNNGTGMSHKLTTAMVVPLPPFDFFPSVPYTDNYHDPLLAMQLRSLVSPELLNGLRMDINRTFGNDRDDNGNGVIDEHWQLVNNFLLNESYKGNVLDEQIYLTTDAAGAPTGGPTDPDNDGVVAIDTNAFLVRQILARHIYVLLMALKPRDYHFNPDTTIAGYLRDEEDAKILAQWAINAVDFRDADSIMTPFEYDIDPFEPHPGTDGGWGVVMVDDNSDGLTDDPLEALYRGSDDFLWSVDGIIDDGTGMLSTDDTANPRRRLVWGCERPEALLNETFSWHDIKQEDTPVNGLVGMANMEEDNDPAVMGAVFDLDQRLRPRGGATIEIYNPWAGRSDRHPAEMSPTGSLQLNKVVAGTSPVWRMLVTRQRDAATDPLDFTDRPDDQPQTGTGAEMSYRQATDVVYFVDPSIGVPTVTDSSNNDSMGNPRPARIHGPTVAISTLPPGWHAVVGTVRMTQDLADPNTGSTDGINEYYVNIGQEKDPATGNTSLLPPDQTRRIVFHPDADPNLNWVFVQDNSNNTPTNAMTSSNIETPPIRVWPEPNPPYPAVPNNYGPATIQPTVAIPVPNLQFSEGRDVDGADTYPAGAANPNGDEVYTPAADLPFDNAGSGFHATASDAALLATNGTKNQFRRIYLQRLANPLLPYNKYTNPYLSIDRMPIDLHVFNGASLAGTVYDGSGLTAAVAGRDFAPADEPSMVTRERGVTGATDKNIWNDNDTVAAAPASPVSDPNHTFVFDNDIKHTLGYLNATFAPTRLQWDYAVPPVSTTAPEKSFVGVAFGFVSPWLTWHNRPYISQYEMILVPKTSSMNLLRQYSPRNEVDSVTSAAISPYLPHEDDDLVISGGSPPNRGAANRGSFHHLLNFFATTFQHGTTLAGLTGELGPDLHLLFELTGTPSRFVGTETWLDPTIFGGSAFGTEYLHPPFNRISHYREPGGVNFNTILNSATDRGSATSDQPWNQSLWQAIMGDNHALPLTIDGGNATSSADRLVRSRRGENAFMTSRTGRISPPDLLPTLTGNPLRSSDGASLVPITKRSALLLESRVPGLGILNMERPPIEVTMLRSDRISADVTPANVNAGGVANSYFPLFGELSAVAMRSTQSANFRYRQFGRLGNLVTTRSNVYAVWITLGYFEVDPVTGQLGQEVGTDGGKVERHRSFYILDRTIPVAFEPGKDHNIERAILLRRYIE